jgi:hypothetical protein
MTLRIRKLELLSVTAVGNFGVTLSFTEGLNIISARNTSGKSTCLMSMLYALGLEGMLGPSQQPPLPDAMSRSIMEHDKEFPVVESRVRLEVENREKKILTVQRRVTGTTLERQLIRCTLGPSITEPSAAFPVRDYYVRFKGSAQEEAGFHRFLAEYLGYDLPNVPAQDETTVPLYLECLMPYFFVDQLTGWRDLKSRMPTYLRVPEMAKRSAEFTLNLDILKRAIRRQAIEQEESRAEAAWTRAIDRAKDVLGEDQMLIRGVPERPTAIWPPSPAPQVLFTDGQNWVVLETAIDNLQGRLDELVGEEIPKAEEVSQQVVDQLRAAEELLSSHTERLHVASKDLMAERAHLESVHKRLHALFDDMRQYQEWKKVQDRGGDVELETSNGRCPCCHQSIKDTLLDQNVAASPMSLEQNIEFISDQIATFRDIWKDAKEVVEAKEKQVSAVGRKIEDINERIRALRRTLRTDGRLPSIAAVQEHLQVEQQMKKLLHARDVALEILQGFETRARDWARIKSDLANVSTLGLTEDDELKLQHLQQSFVQQLQKYDFQSFPIDQIGISHETYRPCRGDYDIGLTSASDTIRIIWAYLIGMLEVTRKFETHHMGLLVFDEPRQQGAEKVSFDELLHRAAQAKNAGQQVIFATSEDQEVLEGIIKDIDCNYRHFDGRILTRLQQS